MGVEAEAVLGEGSKERGERSAAEREEGTAGLDEERELDDPTGPFSFSSHMDTGVSPSSEGLLDTVLMARTRTGSSGSLDESPNQMTGKLIEWDQYRLFLGKEW